jgi:hypothetical protein
MVIDNFNIGRAAWHPNKTNAPLLIYPNRVLAFSIIFEEKRKSSKTDAASNAVSIARLRFTSLLGKPLA